jgi:hypothetical protein
MHHFLPFENENYHRFIISLQANNLTSLSPYATDLTNLKGEKRGNVGKLNNELNIVNQPCRSPFLVVCSSGVNIAKRNITTGLFGLYYPVLFFAVLFFLYFFPRIFSLI